VLGLGVIGIGVYVAVRSPAKVTNDAIVARMRRAREAPPQQQVIYVPVAVGPSATPSPTASAQAEQIAPSAAPPLQAEPPTAAATVPPGEPPPAEDEVAMKRRLGAQEFERDMGYLARKADDADIAWERFLAGCRVNVTSVVAVAGVADRDWLAVAGVSVVQKQWTDACAEAGTFFALAHQVHDGVCVAMDRARRNWVYPGTTRDLRHKYRLDWDGWDSSCR
jgi:hypothetical protein